LSSKSNVTVTGLGAGVGAGVGSVSVGAGVGDDEPEGWSDGVGSSVGVCPGSPDPVGSGVPVGSAVGVGVWWGLRVRLAGGEVGLGSSGVDDAVGATVCDAVGNGQSGGCDIARALAAPAAITSDTATASDANGITMRERSVRPARMDMAFPFLDTAMAWQAALP
jgi:hypothetical protein